MFAVYQAVAEGAVHVSHMSYARLTPGRISRFMLNLLQTMCFRYPKSTLCATILSLMIHLYFHLTIHIDVNSTFILGVLL